jgi:DNA-directed RNA polymerase specialized sigma24 family protein
MAMSPLTAPTRRAQGFRERARLAVREPHAVIEQTFTAWRGRLVRFCTHLLRNADDAEEVVQSRATPTARSLPRSARDRRRAGEGPAFAAAVTAWQQLDARACAPSRRRRAERVARDAPGTATHRGAVGSSTKEPTFDDRIAASVSTTP